MHSNIKVGTIVNIMRVYYDYQRKVIQDEQEVERCKKENDKEGLLYAQIDLNRDKAKLAEFLDYYI